MAAAAAVCTAVLVLVVPAAFAAAQDGDPAQSSTTSSTVEELPPAEMIPRPNSGQEPSDAGDRGGTLQLLVLGLVLLAISAGVTKLVRDARRTRRAGGLG